MRCWQLGDGAWKTSMVSVKKWTGVGKSGVGEEWGASVTAKPFLPGYLVQFIYLQAPNLQFSPSSKGCDLLGCSGWLTHVFISPCRKYLKLAYCGLLGSSQTQQKPWTDWISEKRNKKSTESEPVYEERTCEKLCSQANIHKGKHTVITQYNSELL